MALIKLLGSAPNQVSTNKNFGTMAWQNANGVQLTGDAVINTLTVGLGGGNIATNSAYGYQALLSNTTGANLVAIGYQAGNKNTIGGNNTFIGYQAGYSNTTNSGVAVTFVGSGAGYSNTTGYNDAFGYNALYSVVSGNSNSAFGYNSLKNTTASNNVGFGLGTLSTNTTGAFNTAIGTTALYFNATSSSNTAIGYQALYNNTGAINTSIGYLAGSTLTTGSNNILIGSSATPSSATVSNEITIGNSTNTVIRYPHSYSTVASLPSASTVGRGSRTFVTDALAPVFQATVAGTGAVFTPIYSDGSVWRVG